MVTAAMGMRSASAETPVPRPVLGSSDAFVSASLECSHDGTSWFPIGTLRTATGLDISEKVRILKSVLKRFHRFRVEGP